MPVIRRPLVVLLALALLAGLLASAPAAQGQSTTIYVAPNGSDDNPGTRACYARSRPPSSRRTVRVAG